MADPAVPLLALGTTRYWRAEDGLRIDAGPFVRALEYATGRAAVVLDVGDPAFYRTATADVGLDPAEVVMVGGDLRTDVEGAQGAGVAGVLVRTGKFAPSDVTTSPTPCSTRSRPPAWWASRLSHRIPSTPSAPPAARDDGARERYRWVISRNALVESPPSSRTATGWSRCSAGGMGVVWQAWDERLAAPSR